jgi:RNA polymerase sigma factor (sigma-70 family)
MAMVPSDDAWLRATPVDPERFAAFYRAHAREVLGYFVRRTGDPEVAADLTAETFAAALEGARRFDPAHGPAVGWLFGIARHQVSRAARRGVVDDRARRRLAMRPIVLEDAALERIEAVASLDVRVEVLAEAVAGLPDEQREALAARVLDEREYDEIAASIRCSPSVVRKRVSRGLARLRASAPRRPRRPPARPPPTSRRARATASASGSASASRRATAYPSTPTSTAGTTARATRCASRAPTSAPPGARSSRSSTGSRPSTPSMPEPAASS